uniref:Uncharacterized protein LOC101242677 n=1 Tax=Phallusia mammillata TaxID=59560 RepID=A0A6F9DJK4_9ASCI|nr:uncharacterized protein LOC101242677 [Phallusia mammillata]
MKVIVAGLSKTGTKSMVWALQELGYEVYDFLEHFIYHQKIWTKIMSEGGSTEDFRQMYENVDAITDLPASAYWDEIHKAFPESKIILMMRESEDDWIRSIDAQGTELNTWTAKLICILSPTARKVDHFLTMISVAVFGFVPASHIISQPRYNELQYKMKYRRHNAHVLQNAPKDKLLVYSIKEGWEPLCKFLGKQVPNTEFPHRNKSGTNIFELVKGEPAVLRVFKEAALSLAVIACAVSFCTYKMYTADSIGQLLSDCTYAIQETISSVWG